MKNIILITFALVLGVAEAWGQGIQTFTAGRWQSPSVEGSTTSIPIAVQDNAVVFYRVNHGVTVNISAITVTRDGTININASGRTGAQPAIFLPESATLVITGDGTINLTGGNGADGVEGKLLSNDGGDGGGGAAPGIGGKGGTGGQGGLTAGNSKYGTLGTGMGKLYILGNVTVNVKKGKEGVSKVGTSVVGGGDGGKTPQYAIGGGGRGGNSKDGESSASSSPYYNQTPNNGYIFIQNTATVTYKNGQGATDTSRPDVQTEPTLKALSDVGYTFTGYRVGETWVVDEYGIYVDGGNLFDKTITVLDERWTKTITLDQQGGTGGSEEIEVVYGCSMKAATAPSKSGYTFMGYFTEPNGGGTQYYDADMSSAHIWDKANNTTTLYAHWTANSYTVTLDANGGTGGTTSVSATYDSAMPSATAPTRTGYTFTGYYYNDTQYYDGSMTSTHTWDRASATTLQAHWTINNYTLTYDVNGGNALSPDHKSVTYNTAYGELPTPTRTGYTFVGWYTQAIGGTAVSSSTIMGAGDVTIHAHWTANIYTVQFDKQSGSGGTASVIATYDSAMPSAEAPSRTGYTFGGYYSEASGGGTQYYDADMSSTHNWDINTNPSTLYAKWTVKQYTVNLDKQDGTGGTSSVTVNYDSAMPSATAPSRTGYTFKGYYSEQNGGGTQYYAEDMNSAHNWDIDTNPSTLYAKWEANKCTINLDKQGGSGGTAYVTGTYDSAMPSATAPSRTGYTFAGYYTLPNGGGTQYYDENMVSVNYWNITTNPSTLYANWTANTYTLNFDVQNGDALSPSTQSVTYDAAYGTLPTPTRYGFAFKGWYTTPNGGSETDTEVLTSDIYSIDGDQTIYAHWNTIVVDIDAYSAETQLAGNYFRTFYDSQIAHILPTGVKAYKGKIEGNNLVLTAIEAKDDDDNDIIPKNVPVILRMMPNEEAGVPIPGDLYQIKIKQISLTTSESELTIDNTDNELIGSDIVIATAVANSYILSFGSNGLGFYEWSTHPLEAHKAYVIKDSANPAKALTFRFEDDVTGINDAIKDFMFNDSNMAIYNLNGIRLSKPQKGLNIINGRKVWVK